MTFVNRVDKFNPRLLPITRVIDGSYEGGTCIIIVSIQLYCRVFGAFAPGGLFLFVDFLHFFRVVGLICRTSCQCHCYEGFGVIGVIQLFRFRFELLYLVLWDSL